MLAAVHRWLGFLARAADGDGHRHGWVEPSSDVTRAIYAELEYGYEGDYADYGAVTAGTLLDGAGTAGTGVDSSPAAAAPEAAPVVTATPAKHRGIRWRRRKQGKAA